MQHAALALIAGMTCATAGLNAQLTTPADWKWRPDTAAELAAGLKVGPGSWAFVQMPPGWHVTTGPGVLLYSSARADLSGNYVLESEIFLFPGSSADEYGIFLGGQGIDSPTAPDYAAFVLRRDGHAAALRRRGGQLVALAEWRRHDAIVPGHADGEPVKNVLKVDLDPSTATLWVNNAKVFSVPRTELGPDGRIGFRVGKDMNLHITSLNVTQKLAPVPVKKDQ